MDELPEVLWAYQCSPLNTIRETLFNLMYGTNVMLPSLKRPILVMDLHDI